MSYINTTPSSNPPTERTHVLVWEVAVSVDTSNTIDEEYLMWYVKPAIRQVLEEARPMIEQSVNNLSESRKREKIRGRFQVGFVHSQKWNCSEREKIWRNPVEGYVSIHLSPDTLMYTWENSTERHLNSEIPDDRMYVSEKARHGEQVSAYPNIRRRTAMEILRQNVNRGSIINGMLQKVREYVLGEVGDGVQPDSRYRF